MIYSTVHQLELVWHCSQKKYGIRFIFHFLQDIEPETNLLGEKNPRTAKIMADKLRPDELAAFKAAFDMFDKNTDGTISTKVWSHDTKL